MLQVLFDIKGSDVERNAALHKFALPGAVAHNRGEKLNTTGTQQINSNITVMRHKIIEKLSLNK
uniref:Uncharacterized protein n=1 Tax=Parascaris univalens TaxID=6257 RepID=A0A914ZKZ4_PARUN